MERVRDLAVDPRETPGDDDPFRQVLINTHSPGVVRLVDSQDLLFAETSVYRTENGQVTRRLRLRPQAGTWRVSDATGDFVTKLDILPYPEAPPDAQLAPDLNGRAA